MADLDVHVERQGPRAVLAVTGELDLATVAALQAAVAGQLAAGPLTDLVLDLGGVRFLDSSGLGALLRARSDAQAAGVTLTLAAVPPGPSRVIELAGLAGTFGLGV